MTTFFSSSSSVSSRLELTAMSASISVDEALRARGRPLEEHVLEIVRQPELRRGFIAAPCANPQLDRYDFTGGVLLNEDTDSVGQHVAGRGRDRRPGLAGARTRRQG